MVQFSMQIQRGDGGGILLRASSQEGTGFYYLYLSTDGAYNLQYWPNDTGGKSAISLERGLSDTFYMDQVLRHWSVVTVVAQAENFAIYIDRSYVASVRDKSVSSGHIGLIAQKEINDTEISYKQVQIWTL
jgi:hypothetical protein